MEKVEQDNIRHRHQPLFEKKEHLGNVTNNTSSDSGLFTELNIPVVVVNDKQYKITKKEQLASTTEIRKKSDILDHNCFSNTCVKSKEYVLKRDVCHTNLKENASSIAMQTVFPFLMAGFGMVSAGVFLDKVQHWNIFKKVPEIFILVPALLGLKGNLEMTLASRLSTYANRGHLDLPDKCWRIIGINIITVEAQALVVAFIASLLALCLSFISTNKWDSNHAIILCAGSLLTGAIASAVLAFVMISVVLLSRRLKVNPDNVATPIAASLGDLVTLSLLTFITQSLFSIVYDPQLSWIGPVIIIALLNVALVCIYISYKNEISKAIILHCWLPVLSAMAISSAGGYILNVTVSKYKEFAMYAPIINGVGGNLVAIQASRISTYLHTSGCSLGTIPKDKQAYFSKPWKAFLSGNIHAVGAKVMLSMVVPGQIIFLFVLTMFQPGHVSISSLFVFCYLFFSLVQVAILLQICNWLVLHLWIAGKDPDLFAIPYLTGLGDFLGTALLAIAFDILNTFSST